MTAFQYGFAESFEAAGQVTLADTASSISVASGKTVTGSGQFTGTGGLTKNGLGTLSLTAANNFSGPVAVQSGLLNLNASSGAAAGSISSVSVASGATLLLSRSDQVNNTATVTLSGGTIRRGGNVGEVFGNLNLTEASFLDYGAANDAGTIRFGTYAPSALLTVQNFLPGNKLQFGNTISSTDLNNTSLFQFSNGFTTGTESGFFTITAIPEPSTYLAALGLLALMLWPLRHRLRGKA
jgi:autotransporter-associated beta strand protein